MFTKKRKKKKQIIHIYFCYPFFSSLTLKAEGKIGQVGIPDRKANLFNIKKSKSLRLHNIFFRKKICIRNEKVMIKIPNVLKVYGLICYICLLELRDLFFLIIKVYIEMTWHNRFSKNKVKKIVNM